jgi:hypothetical protein
MADGGRTEALRGRGAEVSARYTPAAIVPQWQAYLDRWKGGAA